MSSLAQDFSASLSTESSDPQGQNSLDPIFLGSMCQFSDPFSMLYSLSASTLPCTFTLSPEQSFSRTTPPALSNQLTFSPELLGPVPMQSFDYQNATVDSTSIELDRYISIPATSPDKCNTVDDFSAPLNTVNPWVYSSSGFDLIGILSRVINRPCPAIHIGPVDLSCAFLVVDARKFDFPIVYASESFEKLTGYNNLEIVGRNCRFLQSPDGHVSLGSRRRYTDNTVVHQIKNSMVNSKESQVSIVNYKKNGQPFINLITIIPVSFGEAITYYVGFQVDMVDQPNAIMEKMKNGTYAVNYSSLALPSYLSAGIDEGFQRLPNNPSYQNTVDLFESIMGKPRNEDSQRDWSQLLIENSDEFIYVLTLKGIILYASPSSLPLFGYNNEDLMGHSISKICHPSDIVPIMREMKESVNSSDSSLGLTFRTRCSNGQYTWMESVGKLHADSAKGRRCIVFSGRVRPQMNLSLQTVLASGEIGSDEYWSRISSDGLYLFATSSCFQAIGYTSEELMGTSMYQLIRSDRTAALTQALQQAREGAPMQLSHQIQSKRGQTLTATSYFYPTGVSETLLCRTKLGDFFVSDTIPFPIITPPNSQTDTNIFEAVEPSNNNTWQYELHQLQLANERLQQEITALTTNSPAGTKKSKRRHTRLTSLICMTCHRTESPEWRRGPLGPKTLCNSCGIKYAKKASTKRPSTGPRSFGSGGSAASSSHGSDGESGVNFYRPVKMLKPSP